MCPLAHFIHSNLKPNMIFPSVIDTVKLHFFVLKTRLCNYVFLLLLRESVMHLLFDSHRERLCSRRFFSGLVISSWQEEPFSVNHYFLLECVFSSHKIILFPHETILFPSRVNCKLPVNVHCISLLFTMKEAMCLLTYGYTRGR